ncbi:MAG: NifB/NifX family molybdenum-iron cluster-binding protein [Desulfohalobiaceae bacterium]|nr:NifB/NifX family molybdenum-iron cluster-binding protein [Desulfohalobiaceae bacterium]
MYGQITGCEKRENAAKTSDGPSEHGQSQKIADLLEDCDIFMGGSMSKNSMRKLTAAHVDCILAEYESIHEAVDNFLQGVDQGFRFFDSKSETLRPCKERQKIFTKFF